MSARKRKLSTNGAVVSLGAEVNNNHATTLKCSVTQDDDEAALLASLATALGLQQDSGKINVLKAAVEALQDQGGALLRDTSISETSDSGGEGVEGVEDQQQGGAEDFTVLQLDDPRPADQVLDGHSLVRDSEAFFQWLISPCTTKTFLEDVFETRPMLVRRAQHPNYYAGWISSQEVLQLASTHKLMYGLNVDVVQYKDGRRETLNENDDGSSDVVDAQVVSRRFSEGCSVRLLHPQRWSDAVYRMLAALESMWSCVTGCNAYLTPPGSQGFAPHYDDIEAFVLQIEGCKRWLLYAPITDEDMLARYSSPDYKQSELGEPILDVVLQPGDLLYMPRGTIHQALVSSNDESASLHLTVSVNQRRSWADLMDMVLPRAVALAAQECVEFRRSLPLDLFEVMGVVYSDQETEAREAIKEQLHDLMDKLLQYLPLDSGVDQMAVEFMRNRLPPLCATNLKQQRSADTVQLTTKDVVRLSGPGLARLVVEDDNAVVYHCLNNSRQQHATHPQEHENVATNHDEGHADTPETMRNEGEAGDTGHMSFQLEAALLLELLLCDNERDEDGVGVQGRSATAGSSGEAPCWVIKDLPAVEECDTLQVVQRLFNEGILTKVGA